MERFQDEAIVLSVTDYGESDRIVTMLTLGRGRLSAFAAGARKSKKRFAGALELGTHLKAQLVERRGDTYRFDGAEIVRSFHHLRDDLGLIARSVYCLELCRELTRDEQAHRPLFDALVSYLSRLDDRLAGPTSLIAFELDALHCTGFRPRFSSCVVCEGPTGERPRFDPEHGGVACANCAARVPRSLALSAALVDAFHRLQEGERTPWPPEFRKKARELLGAFISHHLGRRLKSAAFMDQMGID
jgi:DNA repair protein RecO (recombination protein O)